MTVARKPGASDRTITADEAEIWQSATRALAPVKGKPRVAPTEAGTRAAKPRGWQAGNPIAAASPPAPPAELERRQARRIASGRIAIAARLDLHGDHQDQARARLRTFLFAAHARGELTVLVITGKGASPGEPAGEPPRGVLRRNVPHWLAEPDLSAIVAGFSEASVRHGGAGALYVRLRKPWRRAQDGTEPAAR